MVIPCSRSSLKPSVNNAKFTFPFQTPMSKEEYFYRSIFGFQPHAYSGPETGNKEFVSYVLKNNKHLLSGESLLDALVLLDKYKIQYKLYSE